MRHSLGIYGALLGLAVVLGSSSAVQAGPVLGGQVYTSGGNISVEILGGSAGHFSKIYLDNSGVPGGSLVGNNQTMLGHVEAISGLTPHQELIFRIDNTTSGQTFFIGPASRNGDNFIHATVDWDFVPGKALIEFEDLLNGGDQDYNDIRFLVSGKLSPTPNPEPVSMAIWGLGASGAWFIARRKRLAI